MQIPEDYRTEAFVEFVRGLVREEIVNLSREIPPDTIEGVVLQRLAEVIERQEAAAAREQDALGNPNPKKSEEALLEALE